MPEARQCVDIVATPGNEPQVRAAQAMAAGLARHGFKSRHLVGAVQSNASLAVVWGWRRGARLRKLGRTVLVMERAYLRDRKWWVSLGWNGLNGRAIHVEHDDGGARWERHFGDLMQPWRTRDDGYALILGQVPGDMAVQGLRVAEWAARTTEALRLAGHEVRWRPHPQAPALECGAPRLNGELAAALAGARFVVTYNSNAGVDAVIAGVPTVTLDAGAMAWPVASHELAAPIWCPDRGPWARRLAYTQWLPDEIASGEAWEYLAKARPA